MQTALELSFENRVEYAKNPAAKRLFSLMAKKKTNLCFNPDVTATGDLLKLADLIGPEICLLKTHVDILEDFSQDFIYELKKISEKHQFLIFEDRKFADIGAVAKMQYEKGIYRISDWADFTNAHPLSGPGTVEGLGQVGLPKGRGLFLIAQMSAQGCMITEEYTKKTAQMALAYKDFIAGFICRGSIIDDPGFLHLTPGVQKSRLSDGLGQRYLTPEKVLLEQKSDIIIVGRGIYAAEDPLAEARFYRQEAWNAYLAKVHSA